MQQKKRTIMESRGKNASLTLTRGLRNYHEAICESIERHSRAHSSPLPPIKHKTRWTGGVCLICGEYMEVITNMHAEKHGFKSADDMIEAGKVRLN